MQQIILACQLSTPSGKHGNMPYHYHMPVRNDLLALNHQTAVATMLDPVDLPDNLKYRFIKKVSVHLVITIQKVTSNVQSVTRQSPDIY